VVLGKASKALVSVFGMVRYSEECLERAELSSLPSTKVYFNYILAIVLNSFPEMKSISFASPPFLRLLTDPVFNVGSVFLC